VYKAWLCYPATFDDDDLDDVKPEIAFEEPGRYRYTKVIPIQFSVLHNWSDKEERLYK
jgi:hypothetical protein